MAATRHPSLPACTVWPNLHQHNPNPRKSATTHEQSGPYHFSLWWRRGVAVIRLARPLPRPGWLHAKLRFDAEETERETLDGERRGRGALMAAKRSRWSGDSWRAGARMEVSRMGRRWTGLGSGDSMRAIWAQPDFGTLGSGYFLFFLKKKTGKRFILPPSTMAKFCSFFLNCKIGNSSSLVIS